MDLNKDIYLQVILEKNKKIEEENLLLNALLIQKSNDIEELKITLAEYNVKENNTSNEG